MKRGKFLVRMPRVRIKSEKPHSTKKGARGYDRGTNRRVKNAARKGDDGNG